MAGSSRAVTIPLASPEAALHEPQRDQPRVEVLVNSPGAWSSVRIEQPFAALQQRGWDVRLHAKPFALDRVVRPGSLVVWQRPLPESQAQWLAAVAWLRQQSCLLLVEWDDHPDLFPAGIQQQARAVHWAHLRCAHGLQTSSLPLQRVLETFHPRVWLVENAVHPVPPLRSAHNSGPLRVLLANFNRELEHRQIAPALARWMAEPQGPNLVTIGPSGLDDQLPSERLECLPVQPYPAYRQVLSGCAIALLPLAAGVGQACKTAIKWQEAAAESVAVVAGPELYGPWLGEKHYGLYARDLDAVVPLARQLAADPAWRQGIVARAHTRATQLQLDSQIGWRMELYRHLWRLRGVLDRQLLRRYPQLGQR